MNIHSSLLCAGALALGCVAGAAPPVLLRTPAWAPSPESPYGLMVRATPEADGFLIKREMGSDSVVYRFQAGAARLELVDAARWQAAGTPVADCEHAPVFAKFRYDIEHGTLSRDGRALAIPGYVVSERRSYDGHYLAVLSGAGRGRSLMPFFGGGGGRPPYTHSLLSLPDGGVLGASVPLAFDGPNNACWSRDNRFVIYTNLYLTHMAVVETHLPRNPP
jgi:hypothetical protein